MNLRIHCITALAKPKIYCFTARANLKISCFTALANLRVYCFITLANLKIRCLIVNLKIHCFTAPANLTGDSRYMNESSGSQTRCLSTPISILSFQLSGGSTYPSLQLLTRKLLGCPSCSSFIIPVFNLYFPFSFTSRVKQ